jgi:hypothetical protein
MSLWSALLTVAVVVALGWADLAFNDSFLTAFLVGKLIDLINWLAFWR